MTEVAEEPHAKCAVCSPPIQPSLTFLLQVTQNDRARRMQGISHNFLDRRNVKIIPAPEKDGAKIPGLCEICINGLEMEGLGGRTGEGLDTHLFTSLKTRCGCPVLARATRRRARPSKPRGGRRAQSGLVVLAAWMLYGVIGQGTPGHAH
jgi:hypothetical protein